MHTKQMSACEYAVLKSAAKAPHRKWSTLKAIIEPTPYARKQGYHSLDNLANRGLIEKRHDGLHGSKGVRISQAGLDYLARQEPKLPDNARGPELKLGMPPTAAPPMVASPWVTTHVPFEPSDAQTWEGERPEPTTFVAPDDAPQLRWTGMPPPASWKLTGKPSFDLCAAILELNARGYLVTKA